MEDPTNGILHARVVVKSSSADLNKLIAANHCLAWS